MPFIALAVVLFAAGIAAAHPGIGVVIDSKGNVFYTDLHQVFRIAPDGNRIVAVPGVHTHELWIDSLDNLYGEHLQFAGEASGRWSHRVWKRAPDGSVSDVIPTRSGFLDDDDDFHFARDRRDAFYWMEGDSLVRGRRPGGEKFDISRGRYRVNGWLTAARDGGAIFVDGDDLVSIDPTGKRTVLAKGVTADANGKSLPFDRHDVEGLFAAADGAVYITVPGRRCVKKASGGTLRVVDQTDVPWKPSGVSVARDGSLWVLEYSPSNAVRVRHAAGGKTIKTWQ